MNPVTSLYRRHRPQTLDEVVGQQHVVRTLRNAIEHDKVNHAYLFVGSRGTGKTSVAKILAKSLNCTDGPTTAPCGECSSCSSIAAGTSLDVIEMDAASHNSVDDIRDLREKVNFVPGEGQWKIYILDEAHMLSNAAWNAFLKTLEEPPPRTIFVLATTEAHKVMPTIIDRCQRFDFRRPSLEQIVEVLQRVAAAEEFTVSEEALGLIARSAAGSFRDAISTLDQLVTYCGKEISFDDVVAVLGLSDTEHLFAATDAVASRDVRAVLEAVERLVASGTEITQFIRDLMFHLRQLLLTQASGEAHRAFGVTKEQADRVAKQAGRLEQAQVLHLLDLLTAAYGAMREGSDARIQLELALVKAARPEADQSTDALSARLAKLEAELERGPEPERARAAMQEAEPEKSAASPVAGDTGPEGSDGKKASKESSGEASTPTIDEVREAWPTLLEKLGGLEDGALLAALLSEARPMKLDGALLTVAYPESASFIKRKADDKGNREKLKRAISDISGWEVSLVFELDESLEGRPVEPEPQLSESEVVDMIKREFDAEEVT